MNGMYLLGLGYGGFGILNGTLSYGTLMAMMQLISQIQSPFANITGYLPKFYAMTASAERLMNVENFEDESSDILEKSEIDKLYHNELVEIAFQNAQYYTYKKSRRYFYSE